MTTKQRVGFGRGFLALFGALGSLLRTPSTWPLALVPAVLFVLVQSGFVLGWWRYLKPWLNEELSGEGKLQNFAALLAAWGSLLPLLVLGWFLVPVLSAPALDGIVVRVERELGAPERAPLGIFAELWCGFRAMRMSLLLTLPAMAALTVLGLLLPPVVVVTTPLKLLIGALGVAWGMFDYPLTLRGVGVRARLAFMRRHFSAVLGFGVAFSLLFWLPCFSILMLPIGVAGATKLYWEIQRSAP
jgi:CysZ protein